MSKTSCRPLLLGTLTNAGASKQVISYDGSDFIKRYDAGNSTSFPDKFVFMSHNREVCADGINCLLPISKRPKHGRVYISPLFPKEKLPLIGLNVLSTSSMIPELTGLSIEAIPVSESVDLYASRIQIHFVSEENGAATTLVAQEQLKQRFAIFLDREDVHCVGYNYDWFGSDAEYSEIWIKTDQSNEQTA